MQLDRKRFEDIYSRQQESGLTIKDFCSNEGINQSKFYYWLRRIRQSSHPLVNNGFLPLTIEAPASVPGDYVGMENQLEITYPEGTILRLRGNITVDDILTLLKSR